MGYVSGQSQRPQAANGHPSHIQFPPLATIAGKMLRGVMIIVPAFAIGKNRNPPAVGRVIVCSIVAIAKLVANAVDTTGAMKTEK